MFSKLLNGHTIILGSQSPRRKYLLEELGIPFTTRVLEVEETHPEHLKRNEIAVFLSELKGTAFKNKISPKDIVITSDTIVCYEDKTLHKPKDVVDATAMLKLLSGKTHQVYTGVCFTTDTTQYSFYEVTDVTFHELTNEEISNYIETCQPFDKAGSYGIQEWMGYAGIQKINGDFFNVMGLPLQKLYRELNQFING